ncbi:integrase-type DNA-binding superfamily protein, partial [Striga asiatica]
RNSLLAQLSWVTPPQISAENATPITVHPLPLEDSYKPKEETALGTGSGSSNGSASSPSKDHALHQFPEIKRRKRHRRKQVENQEPCIMRGVYFKNLKWQAAIKVDKKQIHLGTVGSQEEAARLYDSQRRNGSLRRKHEDNEWVGEQVRNGFSASEDDMLAP